MLSKYKHTFTKKGRRRRRRRIWQFSQLCWMGTLLTEAVDLCHLALQHLRRLTLEVVFFVLSCCFNTNTHLRKRERKEGHPEP
jgi:hypothetical protein